MAFPGLPELLLCVTANVKAILLNSGSLSGSHSTLKGQSRLDTQVAFGKPFRVSLG